MVDDKIIKDEDEWKQQLSREQYHVIREHGTEPAFSGNYHDCKLNGIYRCAACGQPLFDSRQKYDSGSGWPSYWQPVNDEAVATHGDNRHGMARTEVHCSRCDAHLGHVFPDGPPPTGLRYCINSLSLQLDESKDRES